MKNILATSILCVTIGLVAAGCGGSDGSSSTTTGEGDQVPAAAGAARAPGSGKVTEVSGSTAQVQSDTAQVAVSWTDKTTFTKQVSAKASAVTVGSCVTVTSADQGSDASTAEVAAASVRITEATDGSCAIPGGGGSGRPADSERPEGAEGERPTDMPSGAPGGGRRGGFAVGEVTAVTDSGFTVESAQPDADDSSPTTVAVTTSADTTYTTTEAGAASDIEVGICVTSRGESDDTGAVTAATIAVSQPVDDKCGGGFGGGAGRS